MFASRYNETRHLRDAGSDSQDKAWQHDGLIRNGLLKSGGGRHVISMYKRFDVFVTSFIFAYDIPQFKR